MMEKYTKLRCDTFLVIVLTSLAFCCVFSAGNSKVGQNKKKNLYKRNLQNTLRLRSASKCFLPDRRDFASAKKRQGLRKRKRISDWLKVQLQNVFSLSLFFFYSVAVVLCQVCTVFFFLFLILVLQYINIFTFLTFPFFEITAIFFNKKRKLVIFNDASAASFVFNLLMNPSPREAGGFFRLLQMSSLPKQAENASLKSDLQVDPRISTEGASERDPDPIHS